MDSTNSVVAVFADHPEAEAAVKKLTEAGFDMKQLSVVGKGYHTEEKVVGFYNLGDRVKFWGSRGVFWGGLWGLFFGGLFLTIPVVGHVIVLGYLAATAVSAVEGAVMVGGISAIGAALASTAASTPGGALVVVGWAILAYGIHRLGRSREASGASSSPPSSRAS